MDYRSNEVTYSFDVDLNITEDLLPYVKIALLTKKNSNEIIQFSRPEYFGYQYFDIFYMYGDGDLLYAGPYLTNSILYNNNYWRAKHIAVATPTYGIVLWYPGESWTIHWITYNGIYYLTTPMASQLGSYKIMPYNVITVKRNIGEQLVVINDINPSYDVPDGYNFPNLERRESTDNPTVPNMYKLWTKLNNTKYKFRLWGTFFKINDEIEVDSQTYSKWINTYVPHYIFNDPFYKSGYISNSINTQTETLSLKGSHPTDQKVKLLISYINNTYQHEIREYKSQN